ncbi:MAG: bifunctional 5,10-methylenetetrahydrofolate dehydrogenase/5,10-methenyltetrahydrofolate cyclohydrolase [Candidatus Curtissbacteria bacterium]|nr:bifunctional 5,10-methylenetetrahydrofolate dehydrogenase/5,10-methenyltetrahydrofolate cyclohydrolase [Candidatus Curtissbacteria bacterium]
MAQILDGRVVRDEIEKKLKAEVEKLDPKPKLVIIQVGNNPESNTYIGQKVKFGEKIGAIVDHQKFAEGVSRQELLSKISKLNSDSSVHGIIVQMPIPKSLNKDEIIEAIDPQKDVDGQNSINLKRLMENDQSGFTPATTKGIFSLLNFYRIPVEGKYVAVIGRSTLVGKPTALAMLNHDATVTVAHSKTRDLKKITKLADVLIVATGKAKLITADHVSKNQVVVDVGINVVDDPTDEKPETEPSGRKLIGDVDFEEVSKIVAAISPVPGGAGPMTVASLFENLIAAYKKQT